MPATDATLRDRNDPMTSPFTGVAVALVTMFDEAGRLLANATAEHAAGLAERGVRAIVIAGTTGEGAQLDAADRREILAAVLPAVPDSLPVFVGTGDAVAERSLELTRDAVQGGAAGVLIFPPDDEAPEAFFTRVRAVAGDLFVLAYHFPKHYPAIPVERLGGLDVDGLKDSEGDASRLRQEAGNWLRPVYTGFVPLLSVAAGFGATGAILALANLRPELCARAFAGDADAQAELLPQHEALRAGGVAVIKQTLAREHGSPAHMRSARPPREMRVTA
jgi:4-hydroxy-tetrahydrodipicolinate synthase